MRFFKADLSGTTRMHPAVSYNAPLYPVSEKTDPSSRFSAGLNSSF
jgi:hypothetical protein